MNTDNIKAAIDLANETYKAGYETGREIGFNEGLHAAEELIGGKAPEQIILERREQLAVEKREKEWHPSCSICRRDHGPEIVHECE